MRGISRVRGVALLSFAVLAGAAQADTVKVKYTGKGLGRDVQMTFGSSTTNLFAGQLKHQFTDGVGPIGSTIAGELRTFCTDLTQYVTNTTKTYQVVALQAVPGAGMGADKAQAIRNMYAFAHDAQFATGNNNTNKDLAAAFQMAVWEIVYDYSGGRSSLDVTTGSLKFKQTNGSALSLGVRTQLNNLFNASMTDGAYRSIVAVSNDSFQDQIVQLNTVPMPAAAGMGFCGLAGVAARRRRR